MRQLESLYPGQKWVSNNRVVFGMAKKAQLAICGSIGVAIRQLKGRSRVRLEPNDIDFVTDKANYALVFLESVQQFLASKQIYYQIRINNRTTFCPDNVVTHYRIDVPFWKPICVFVRSDEVKAYRIDGGYIVQFYEQVKEARDAMREIDGKHDDLDEDDDFPDQITPTPKKYLNV